VRRAVSGEGYAASRFEVACPDADKRFLAVRLISVKLGGVAGFYAIGNLAIKVRMAEYKNCMAPNHSIEAQFVRLRGL
jgi:hypothetical protein